eukprot:CAMPEP_0179854808 /NCGR_PEP_ID=MMETSP0982-20121206/10163_1 /TAXON_ID=483367 /ORGANISM="non described non described, Strain CCMP 2436" /LENGTH=136 /DNA_ID=CAMNT_0021740783 /DNA_START=248 /DNA_END=658 /DNA_ORIENTATION=+
MNGTGTGRARGIEERRSWLLQAGPPQVRHGLEGNAIALEGRWIPRRDLCSTLGWQLEARSVGLEHGEQVGQAVIGCEHAEALLLFARGLPYHALERGRLLAAQEVHHDHHRPTGHLGQVQVSGGLRGELRERFGAV